MTKILFVCHGNICRSPMAEFIMKRLVQDAGRDSEFEIASAATSTEEIGNSVYPPARRKLAEHGISCAGKTARQMTRRDYDYYDLLIGMDNENLLNMRRMTNGDPQGKIHLLMEYTLDNTPKNSRTESINTAKKRPAENFYTMKKHDPDIRPIASVADPWYTGDFDATWRDCLAGCKALLEIL